METTWWHPLWILRHHQRGGVRICRIAEIIIDKAEDYKFPLRESKNKSERSLENTEINYTHMFDCKIEDNTPILKELDSTITQEPILEELNGEEDRLEFTTNNMTWTFTARARENANVSLEEPVLNGGSSSSGATRKVSEVSPTSVKARVAEIEKNIGFSKRKYTPMQRPKPEDVFPGDPKWERIGDRVIRRYKGTNKPEGGLARGLARYFTQRKKYISKRG